MLFIKVGYFSAHSQNSAGRELTGSKKSSLVGKGVEETTGPSVGQSLIHLTRRRSRRSGALT
jgi:hypothetical protein